MSDGAHCGPREEGHHGSTTHASLPTRSRTPELPAPSPPPLSGVTAHLLGTETRTETSLSPHTHHNAGRPAGLTQVKALVPLSAC